MMLSMFLRYLKSFSSVGQEKVCSNFDKKKNQMVTSIPMAQNKTVFLFHEEWRSYLKAHKNDKGDVSILKNCVAIEFVESKSQVPDLPVQSNGHAGHSIRVATNSSECNNKCFSKKDQTIAKL